MHIISKYGTCSCGGHGGCGGWGPSEFGGGCVGHSGVFPVLCFLYSNDLSCEVVKHYYQHYQLHLGNNSRKFLMS